VTVEERLRDARAPDEREAAARAWATVRAAAVKQPLDPAESGNVAERPRGDRLRPPRRSWVRRRSARLGPARSTGVHRALLAAVGAAAALALAAALTPAGASISRLVRHAVSAPKPHRVAPARPHLPSAGHVLVASPTGALIVDRDGTRHPIAGLRDPVWSPHGIYVAGVRGGALVALTPKGTLRWRLPGRNVRDPRWSADGLYIAYESGGALHRVWGNGTHDVEVTQGRGARAWAWRPGIATSAQTFVPELAYVTRRNVLILRHMFTGKVLWRRALGDLHARSLAWSPGGSRLVVVGRRAVILRGRDGRQVGTIPVPLRATPRAAAVSPDGRTAAMTAFDGESTSLLLAPLTPAGAPIRTALTRPGQLEAPTFSPDGRWILLGAANHWLLVPTNGGAPRTVAAAPGPVAGWVR
jgi:WD40-like Beta Propeller Repeat